MIEQNIVFDDFGPYAALWCGTDVEPGDLARAVDFAINQNMDMVSVAPQCVKLIWPWLEKSKVKILSRFYVMDKKITEQKISDITININSVLKNGADGAQIFMRYQSVADLVEQVHVVKDDLFFNKDLIIGLDIADVGPYDWNDLFQNLRKVNAAALTLVMTQDLKEKSDFPGRVYGMLNAWTSENKFDLHFVVGNNPFRIEQVMRITKLIQPQLLENMRFFVNH